jgi:hypothetical protein
MNQQAPIAAWAFEILGPLIWVALAANYVVRCRRAGSLTVPALVFIGATTMWWQEWYGDWGGYVLYNPHLHLIPGYRWPLTSPNKPWAVIPAYGWFYGLVYFPLIGLVHKLRTPGRPAWALILAIGLPVYYLWDLLIEGVASAWGLWSYVDFVGPAITSSRGNFPLVYPIIPFALMTALTAVVINATKPDGTPVVEAIAGVDRFNGNARAGARIATWVVTMNLCYALLFIGPIVLVRLGFLPANDLVP